MSRLITKYWYLLTGILLAALLFYGYQKMYFHQDDLDWFLMANRPFVAVMRAPIGDHVDYMYRVLLKVEWDLFHFNFAPYLTVSMAIHVIVIALLYRLARMTSGRADLAAIAVILFAINTNWTEVVLWISGQTISITAIFVLLAMQAIWQKRGEIKYLFLAGMTSALALGLLPAAGLVYGYKQDGWLKNFRLTKVGWGVGMAGLSVVTLYLTQSSDGTRLEMSMRWLVQVGLVWGLAMINSVVGRLLIPFDRLEMARIALVSLGMVGVAWIWRGKLKEIWQDTWSRFVMIQLGIYYLIVAVGRAQYGVGIMRAERYAYLGLALFLLLMARVFRQIDIKKYTGVVLVIVILQCVSLYRRAEDYIVRPQQLKVLVSELKNDQSKVNPQDYLPHFVLNDERLRYSDLMGLIND
jgi:hypothetical protein